MEDEIILSEAHKSKLDGVISNMLKNKESEANIQFVVNDFKSKYGEVKKKDLQDPISKNTNLESNGTTKVQPISSGVFSIGKSPCFSTAKGSVKSGVLVCVFKS